MTRGEEFEDEITDTRVTVGIVKRALLALDVKQVTT